MMPSLWRAASRRSRPIKPTSGAGGLRLHLGLLNRGKASVSPRGRSRETGYMESEPWRKSLASAQSGIVRPNRSRRDRAAKPRCASERRMLRRALARRAASRARKNPPLSCRPPCATKAAPFGAASSINPYAACCIASPVAACGCKLWR